MKEPAARGITQLSTLRSVEVQMPPSAARGRRRSRVRGAGRDSYACSQAARGEPTSHRRCGRCDMSREGVLCRVRDLYAVSGDTHSPCVY